MNCVLVYVEGEESLNKRSWIDSLNQYACFSAICFSFNKKFTKQLPLAGHCASFRENPVEHLTIWFFLVPISSAANFAL